MQFHLTASNLTFCTELGVCVNCAIVCPYVHCSCVVSHRAELDVLNLDVIGLQRRRIHCPRPISRGHCNKLSPSQNLQTWREKV